MKINMSRSKEIFGEEAQLAAAKNCGYALRYIHNPSEAVQLVAVQSSGYAVRYIHSPSEAVQMAAVLEDGYALQYLHNPSEAVIARALERSPGVIEYIKRAWVEDPVEDAEELTVEELEKRLGHRIKIVGNSNGHSREESP